MSTFHSQKFVTILPYMTKGLCSCDWLRILDRESILDLPECAQCNHKSLNKRKRGRGRRGGRRDMRIEAKMRVIGLLALKVGEGPEPGHEGKL